MSLFDNLKGKFSKEHFEQIGASTAKAFQNASSQQNRIKEWTSAAKKLSRSAVNSVNNVIMTEFEKGDQTSNQDIQAFFVVLTGESQSIIKLNAGDKERYQCPKGYVECDVKGWFYICKKEETSSVESKDTGVLLNAQKVKFDKSYYLYNEDVLCFDTNIPTEDCVMLFSILNQEDTVWKRVQLSSSDFLDYAKEYEFPSVIAYSEDRGLQIELGDEKVYQGRQHLEKNKVFPKFTSILHDDRHYILSNNGLYFQMPLKEEEHKSLALMVHQLQEGDNLDIRIRERVVQQSGKNKKLLENINVSIKTGEMVLILGGSGAGKTTFFNAVMGSEKADADIFIGENDLYRNYSKIKHMIGYVPQKDLVRDTDTVFMTLKDAAQVKLPREFVIDPRLLENRINEVLKTLNIEKEADNLVSKLSGGQKKRLSVAVELISEPAVFFLDEPDSGLDGSQARSLMKNLREIANMGKIIMVISHSPDRTPELYDKVLVLAKSQTDQCGKLAFYGETKEALDFFDTESMELIVGKIDEDADRYINKYQQYKSTETERGY